MAVMVPPQPGPNTKSRAEFRLFERLKSEIGNEWTVLHSVGLVGHAAKRWAEADFVLVGPGGVYCLEVKGGRVTREGGIWKGMNAAGEEHAKAEDPFAQAGGEEATLRKYLRERNCEKTDRGRIAIGYGVAFPDVRFDQAGPEIDPDIVYDARDAQRSMQEYINRLTARWYNRLHEMWGRSPSDLRPQDVSRIVTLIRADFDFRPGLRYRADAAARELVRLTEEQYNLLEGLKDADRVVVKGSAGTGKTMLAVEEARRQATTGRRVLFLCFNVRLASYVRRLFADVPLVEVRHFHGLCRDIIQSAGRLPELPDADDSYLNQIAIPELAFDVVAGGEHEGSYDIVIIDEAQDLLRDEYLAVVSALLRGGLESGRWRAFLDPKQNIFGGDVPSGLKVLETCGGFPFRLTRNCRNTGPIAMRTALLAGIELQETLIAEGPDTEEHEYQDAADQRRRIERAINRLLGERFPPASITILSRYRLERSGVAGGLTGVPFPIVELGSTHDSKPNCIGFSTVHGFKGLENDVILLIDIDDLGSAESLRTVYLGASRARTVLAYFRSTGTSADFAALAEGFGARLEAEA